MALCGLSLHLGSLEGCRTPEQKLSFKQALLSPMVSMNAFHSANLFFFFIVTIFPPIAQLHFLLINTHTTHNSSNFSDEGLLHSKCQLFNSIQWPIYIINSVNNIKLPCYTLPLMQHHSFFRNLPRLPAQQSSTQHVQVEKNFPCFNQFFRILSLFLYTGSCSTHFLPV